MYTQTDIDRANSLDAVEVAQNLEVEMVRRGSKWFACCLWHADSHPSMQVGGSGHEHTCHCYSCGKTASIIDLYMAQKEVGFREALRDLVPASQGESGAQRRRTSLPARAFAPMDKVSGLTAFRGFGFGVADNLFKGLAKVTDRERLCDVWREYEIGGFDDGRFYDCTVFPSITAKGQLLDLKTQWYYGDAGPMFLHSDKQMTRWLGKRLMGDDFVHQDCLFGEHLLPKYPSKAVGLVESPKNALICAIRWPETLWTAVGNKGLLRRDILQPLQGRRVLVLPDYDAWQEWQQRLDGMQDIATFYIPSSMMKEIGRVGQKADVADVLVQELIRDSPT